MPSSPREAFLIASDLKTCILTELEHTAGGIPAGFDACVMPGRITWDNCCPGSLRLSVARQYASDRFPDLILRPSVCAQYSRATDINATILRCMPSPDQDGNPPTCEQLERTAIIQAEDADALWRATRCCFANTDFEYVIREVAAVGPQGACVGTNMLVTIGLVDWCECHG